MLEVLKQMENVTIIKKSQLMTIKGAHHWGSDDCGTASNTKPCSHV